MRYILLKTPIGELQVLSLLCFTPPKTAYFCPASVLPHKTIALLRGLGWIGKNNLFITPQHGAAQCLGTVLTDAPLCAALHEPFLPKCGNCNICSDSCEKRVLKGKTWHITIARKEIIDVYGCDTCLKYLVHCPVTQAYIKNAIIQGEGGFVSKDVTKLPSP